MGSIRMAKSLAIRLTRPENPTDWCYRWTPMPLSTFAQQYRLHATPASQRLFHQAHAFHSHASFPCRQSSAQRHAKLFQPAVVPATDHVATFGRFLSSFHPRSHLPRAYQTLLTYFHSRLTVSVIPTGEPAQLAGSQWSDRGDNADLTPIAGIACIAPFLFPCSRLYTGRLARRCANSTSRNRP